MGYIVFALKYRPQKFADVLGQEHIVTVLSNGVNNNRIPHAMLFSGPRGVGKTTTARILAKALNCDNPKQGEPCLECSSCKAIMEGRDMDVIEIDGASNRGIDEIRDLREKAKYATVKGRYKIFIIDEIHMLTKEAFNALLKILEEPPEHVIFIFATTEPFNVIPTILSRCQRFDFKRIPLKKTVEQLEYICSAENIDFDNDGLKLVAQLADGSLRDATSILDQLASTAEKVTYDNVNIMFGRLNDDFFGRFTEYIIERNPKGLIDSLNDVMARGYDLESFVSEFAFYIHKLFLIKNKIETEETEVMSETVKELAIKQTKEFSNESLMQITTELTETSSKLKFTNNKKLLVENELARIAYLIESKDINDIIAMIKNVNIGEIIKRKPLIEEKKEEKISQSTNIMEKLINLLKTKKFFISEALRMSKIRYTKDNYYELEVPRAYIKDLNQKTIDEEIKEQNLDIEIKIFYNNEEKYNKFKTNPFEDNPLINKLLKETDSQIIE